MARSALRESAIAIGGTVANVVNFANPGVLVLGGGVLRNGDEFFQLFRRTVLERGIQLATQRLSIRPSSMDFTEGIVGAALLAVERLFQRDALAIWVASGSPRGSALRLHQPLALVGP